MLKRFFLKSGAEPIAIGCWPLLLLTFITFVIGLFFTWVFGLSGLFLLALVTWLIICVLVEMKYIFPSSGLRNLLALKVKNGKVLDTSNRLWKEAGYEYHAVTMPGVTEGVFDTTAYLSFEKDGVSTEVSVTLVCCVKEDESVYGEDLPRNGFYPQEVYDFVIRGGQTNLRDMIKKFFKNVAGNDPAVKRAFEEHHADALELKLALTKALEQLSFSLPLSNIKEIKINILGINISL
ncbi:MAG: hypothetical protein MUP45_02240 [Candidatus Marinimicrobia bacterium]|nr:hypothetical protein [Candidatus Neomarinimicrobiota bacterium]